MTAGASQAAGRPAGGVEPGAVEVAGWLVDAAQRWFAPGAAPPEVLAAMRAREPKLLPTYLAAHAALGTGEDLPGRVTVAEGVVVDVPGTVARWHHYADLAQRIEARFPGVRPLKGPVVAACYPAPLVRFLSDIDLAAEDVEQAFAIGRWLVAEEQWGEPEFFALLPHQGRRHGSLTVLRARDDEPRLAVEINTVELIGNLFDVPPVRRLSGDSAAARSLVAIVAERLDREFGLRDVLDGWLLLERLAAGEVPAVTRALRSARLGPEARELEELVLAWTPHRGGFAPAGAGRPALLARRARWALGALGRPARPAWRLLQHLAVFRSAPPWAGRLLTAWAGRTTARAAFRAGALVWGLLLPEDGAERVRADLPDDVVVTPVGSWLLTASPDVPARLEHRLTALGVRM